MRKVVIVAAKRTPVGAFLGELSSLRASELGKFAIKGLLEETNIPLEAVDEVIMGNVLTAGVGQAPARQAALFAGLPNKTECLTINKVCGSGLKAVMLAQQAVALGDADVIIAGGMESMSNAPHLLMNYRKGQKLGDVKMIDSMVFDGLWDVYNNIHMGSCAEAIGREFSLTREELDAFSIESYRRAQKAQSEGLFDDEIVPVPVKSRREEVFVTEDEEPKRTNFEKIPKLKPAFEKDGIITAANSSKINDGAAAVLVMSEDKAREFGLAPMAEIVAHASAAREPIEFPKAPADAINKVLKKADLNLSDIDLFEINEAFAVVSLVVNKMLGLTMENVNVNGGAVALGHPIGASGARLLTTLLHEMKRRDVQYGITSLCIGGGEANAIIVKKYE